MVTTYEDKQGKVFNTREQAKASNLATVPVAPQVQTPIQPQVQTPVQPTISANALAKPTTPVTVPQPQLPTIPTRIDSMKENILGSIRSQSESARKLEEDNRLIGSFIDQNTGADIQKAALKQYGVTPESLKRLEEIQLQLAGTKGESDLTKTRIAGGAGQTLAQGQREITQEDRENAVRSSTLSAEASVLQGNIDLGRELARDAVTVALSDRDMKYTNLIRQNNELSKQVDEETRQLLVAENRGYEEKIAEDNAVKKSVEDAIVSGAATSQEMAQLTSVLPTHPDPDIQEQLQSEAIATKKALAQSITARGATELRDLEVQSKEANIAQSYASAAASNTNRLLALAEAGDPEAINGLGFDPRSITEEVDPVTRRDAEDKLTAGQNLLGLTQQYRDLVDAKGFENTLFGSQETVGQYKALRSQITAAYKDAKKLGTLDAGLLTLMEGIIGEEPTGKGAANFFGGRSTRVVQQLDTLIDQTTKENAQNSLRLGIQPAALQPDDIDEINAAFSQSNQINTTTPAFNPANY